MIPTKEKESEELESILHLAGCQQRTAGYNDAISKKDIDTVDMEEMEATTLREVRAYVQTAERKARIDEIGRRIGGENWTQEEVDFAIQIGMLSQNEIERLASLRSNKGEK